MREQRGLYYGEPTQRVSSERARRLRNTGPIPKQNKQVTTRRVAPERYLATVHTPALVIDGEWSQGDAEIASAIIDDAHEELLYATMEMYDLTHARIVHFTHTPVTVNYLKQGWFGVKKFPVTHFFITMLIEDMG